MALSDTAVRNAKVTGKAYTLPDIDGLSLAVSPIGGKSWHFRYYWVGKQRRMSLGPYPEVSLREARRLRDDARALLVKGTNPHIHRKQKRRAVRLADENTFQAVFEKWVEHRKLVLKEGRQSTLSQIQRIFNKDVLPILGKRPIYEIQRPDLLEVVARIEKRGALSIAEKVRVWFRQMFRYALIIVPDLQQNPAFDLDVVALPQPPARHNPFLRMAELPAMLQMLRNYQGRLQTQLGLRLLLLTGVRTGELRLATPDQFDLERGLWIIPPTVVKQLQLKLRNENRRSDTIPPYIVPLSVQALEIIRFMLERMKPAQHYLFTHASNLKKRISENTLNGALKRMGYKDQLTGHGIRATLSTALNEIGYPKPWIEAQLSHSDPNKVSAAYNHAEYIEQRRHMMQDWADRLDLFEQNLVDAASRVLTVHLEGVPELDETEIEAKEKVEPVISAPTLTVMLQETENAPVIPESGQRLSAVKGPRPVMSDSQRRRQEMLNIFNSSQVVTAADYAKMVGKSRRWISYEIQRRRVLALKIGNLGHRIPGWHFEPLKHKLIQAVLKQCGEVDPWQIHGVLSEPREDLDGRPPIEAVTEHGFHEVALEVCLALKG
ncbi:integrase arm-type DNA-binding domain-containing protein [Porticoccus sp.]|uniref:tyrosine-type recombinase/integrase n=1 Tax=Porticoccus sp. TaxID=2024853 RepID=UPI000C4A4534|nr:integrase arm-type DNA-binding domain-containing protein [Porticoccus sp.]MAZ69274.1 integrase [Porticoccus sp.]|tara:strand:- start:14335 stop:16149 length:1815 start_codon:yes stop_codon:yes gene_type:complete